ncbi:MAG: HDOD domain-containing protein [Deltaproteobacteria bacterium]|nr:HDOD domain-containing protein [Deltaproteobacteria bacterium]
MEFSVFMWIIISSAMAIGAYAAFTNRKAMEKKPVLKKSPARYVTVATEEDIQTFMEIYNLEWKPQQDLAGEIPPDIEKVIDKIENISPLVTDLSVKLSDPDINPQEISKLIITDQGLTSFILKRVNSPYYGLAQKVDNIFSAIVLLGYNEIYRIVMEERSRKIGIQPDKAEWVHANLTSNIAAYLASVARIGVPSGTMVTLGMLHDIAKTIMLKSLPQPEGGFALDLRQRLRQEVELYGIDHATLGGILARRWGMPAKLITCIEKHHWPMFWPLREIGQACPDTIKELAILSISDIAARNFTQEITGPYIGDDYYRFIKKQPKIEGILIPEITKDLKRIHRVMLDDIHEGEETLGMAT